jgi:opacity protein-like surface antigen
MKTTSFIGLGVLALATASQAGTPGAVISPASDSGLWRWFVGGSGGYLTEQDEGMYSLQMGAEYKNPSQRGTHAVLFEIGFTRDDANYQYISNLPGGVSESASIDLNLVPITLNYKYEASITERLNWYAGLGLGIVVLDTSYDWRWSQALPPPNGQRGGSDDKADVRFYGNVFAGLAYEFTGSFEVFAGARYIFMDEVDRSIDVSGASDYTAGIDGDVLIELGARFRF